MDRLLGPLKPTAFLKSMGPRVILPPCPPSWWPWLLDQELYPSKEAPEQKVMSHEAPYLAYASWCSTKFLEKLMLS